MHTKGEGHGLLDRIESPSGLQAFTPAELIDLSREIREFLVSSVSKTGRHLDPSLGVVELMIALYRVFESPKDTFVFDTGHQSYVYKMLTGHKDFTRLREANGLSDYPNHERSIHDVLESSHASPSIAWADRVSVEKRRQGENSWTIATIGDGALTGGMAWEGLSCLTASKDRRVLIIVNDNGHSYAPTIEGLMLHLDALRTSEGYERALSWDKRQLLSLGGPGQTAFDALHAVKTRLKDALIPQVMFEDLSLKRLGPVDGHDITALKSELMLTKTQHSLAILHAIAQKGRGYTPAEEDIADRFHAVGPIHPETGLPVAPARFGWTNVFAEEVVKIARENSKVVGITAAMMKPVDLAPMKKEFLEQAMDIDIAEQEALASTAGMAYEGARPVIVLYATFLNRAFGQLLMDVTLHQVGVAIVLDRAGVTGVDGASHNGI